MRSQTKLAVNKTRVKLIGAIVALVLALGGFLICQLAVGKEKLGFPPFMMLFIVFFLSFGIIYLVLSAIFKRTITMVVGGGSFIVGLAILLLCLSPIVKWYVTLIIVVVLVLILFLLTFVTKAPKLAVEYDNGDGSGRKPYAERAKETEERRAREAEENKATARPEIKSFKKED